MLSGLLLGFLLVPQTVFAQLPFFSFGGRVVSINYCVHGAVNIIVAPAGLFPVSYVWSLPPITISILPAPPTHIGQQVLGLALPVAVPCIGFGSHPPVWYGLQVIYGGASLGF